MSKKNIAKLGLSAAVAASALVAGNPAQAASVSEADKMVNDALASANALKPYFSVTTEDKVIVSPAYWTAYNKAGAAIKKAQGLSLNSAQKTKLASAEETRLKAARFIDAVKLGEVLAEKTAVLEAKLDAQLLDETTVSAYNEVSAAIKKFEAASGKVTGTEVRKTFNAKFLVDAKISREVIKYEIDRYNLHKIIFALLDEKKVEEAKTQVAKLERLETRSVQIKEDLKKLYPEINFELPKVKEQLDAQKAEAGKKIEELDIPKVAGVSAINATQVEIKFNTPVSKASLFADGVSGAFKSTATVTIKSIDSVTNGTLSGELSADGKTLTVTSTVALSKRYDVVVDGLLGSNGKAAEKYNQVVTFAADVTAPTIVSTSKTTAGTFKVTFSEPIKSLGNVSYKLADGTVVAGSGNGVADNFTPGAKEVTFTVGSDVAAGKEVIATFIGAQDQAGNLLTPNPATVSFVKGSKDGVVPTVSSISQTGAKTFAVKFSEELIAKPVVKIGGLVVNAADVVKDSADATKYNVTAPAVLDGATTVVVESFNDISGEMGTDVSRVVTFVKETAAPKVVSSNVIADTATNKQYLEVTFDKDVILANPTVDGVGSYVKDFVTTQVLTPDLTATPVAFKDANNKKVIRVELDTFLGTAADVEGATYTLDLTFAGVKSAADVAADAGKVSFTRGKDGVAANVDVVAVSSVAQGTDNNKVEVTFNKAVDGPSATNVANYKIDGAIVESVTLKPASLGTQVAVLNLKASSNGFTGTRNINISGVKALGSSKVMDAFFTNTVSLRENIAPTVTSAKLTAVDTIKLSFSEAVTSNVADDFEVLVGGIAQATPDLADAVVISGTNATITVTTIDAAKLAKGISLKALTTLDIVDAAGNKVTVPSNITVTQ